ncbi:MAG: MotB family protein [Gammaproteobacteria bacterium]
MSQECATKKQDAGLPAWVMTFADLMSLLLAFFVLLFSFSEMDKNIYKELAGSLKEAFGVQREIKVKEPPKGINIIAREFSPGRPAPTPVNEVRQKTSAEYQEFPVFTDPAERGQENQDVKTDGRGDVLSDDEKDNKLALELARIKIDSELIRKELSDEIENGLIDLEVEEQRIILRIREKGSFPSGSAQLIKPFSSITAKISKVFKDFDGMIIVSGHTDNLPIHTRRFRSNWELSASRAVSVIHELSKDSVLRKKEFELAAYAETLPVDSNSTATGRAKNRRVEITMDYSKISSALPSSGKNDSTVPVSEVNDEIRELPGSSQALVSTNRPPLVGK